MFDESRGEKFIIGQKVLAPKIALEHNIKFIMYGENQSEAHNNLGIILRENGKLKDSENNFNKAIAINPKFAEGSAKEIIEL